MGVALGDGVAVAEGVGDAVAAGDADKSGQSSVKLTGVVGMDVNCSVSVVPLLLLLPHPPKKAAGRTAQAKTRGRNTDGRRKGEKA